MRYLLVQACFELISQDFQQLGAISERNPLVLVVVETVGARDWRRKPDLLVGRLLVDHVDALSWHFDVHDALGKLDIVDKVGLLIGKGLELFEQILHELVGDLVVLVDGQVQDLLWDVPAVCGGADVVVHALDGGGGSWKGLV